MSLVARLGPAQRSPDHDADLRAGHHSAEFVAHHDQPVCAAHDHIASPDPNHVLPGVATATCTTSAAEGSCGPYTYPRIQGTLAQDRPSAQDVWSPISGWQQTLHATDPGNWHVTANMPAGNTAVVSFPNTGANYNSPLISSFPAIYSSFSENMNATSATDVHCRL